MRFHVSIIMILAAILSGCAGTVSPTPPGKALTRADLKSLEQGQEDLSVQMQRIQDNVLLVEARMQDQQRLIEEMRMALAALKVTPSGEKAEPSATEEGAGVSPDKTALSPTEIYLQAFADYTSGRFQQGIAGFESFISRYPESEYAGNAQYWLGECYYSLQSYEQAAQEFARVVEEYPQGNKAPEALLKMASALLRMEQPERAGQALEILLQRYPNSSSARKARESEPFSTILKNGGMQ
jgi:tol-pal system protein YbgF